MKSRAKIYITRQIPQGAIDVLLQQFNVSMWDSTVPVPRGELLNNVKDVDALLCMSTDDIDTAVIENAGPNLKVIGTVSDDFSHIDLDTCQLRGIDVVRPPIVSMETVAELTVSLLIESSQKWTVQKEKITENENRHDNRRVMSTQDFHDKIVGIIGLGELGLAVENQLRSGGIHQIVYSDPFREKGSNESCKKILTLDNLLVEADVVCVCCKELEDSNRNKTILLNRNAFKTMKKSAILINATKGHVINYPDLYESLREEEIAAAGLLRREQGCIPYNDPLLCLHNCFFANFKECDKTYTKTGKYYENVAINIVETLLSKAETLDGDVEFER